MTSRNPRASFSSSPAALLAIPYSVTQANPINVDLNTLNPNTGTYTVADPTYLSSQLKSAEWLHRYGLKSQKLTFDQILQQIGFKRVESYTSSVGKTVGAKYAGSLYQEIQNDNGDRYVLTCRPEKLREFQNRLSRLLNILQKRLIFINSGSRRFFGIIGEPSVCLVCDCKTVDQRLFNQFQSAIIGLLKEQVSKIKRFNIIWVGHDSVQFKDKPVDATTESIDEAVNWINDRKLTRTKISISVTCEAILKAFTNHVHSIYLITEGNSSDGAREMLRDNIVKTRLSSNTPIPIHVVSLFCSNNDTEIFLRSIAQTGEGSYFSYKIKNELTNFQSTNNLMNPTKIKLEENRLQFGTNALTPNSEQPTDIALMYKEIQQCQNIIDRLDKILGNIKVDPLAEKNDTSKSLDIFNPGKQVSVSETNLQRSLIIQSSALFNYDENDMASIDWLKIYGVNAQKLDFYSTIQPAAFRHCDGIVTLHQPPENAQAKRTPSANASEKLINAKYCDQFAHVAWSDGTIRHVYVTPELHRDYERRMRALVEKIKARLSWLKKGSRDVFGTILEKNIYILIDTSKSMENHIEFVKDKLRLLIQDQLFSKERVNMVSFSTIINPWRDRLTRILSSSTQTQLQSWIETLHAEGSTNTLAALRYAIADAGTEAIYLLTDGRPDQNERHILSQIQYRQVLPVHTIAFNIQDQTANQFLFDLAKQTGGRFHAFNYGLENSSSIEIPESEDISYLKKEIALAEKELQRVADLRDECMNRTWSQENRPTKLQISPVNELLTRSLSTVELSARPNSSSMLKRSTQRKKRTSTSLQRKSTVEYTNILNLNPNQWLLPETEEYLKTNRKLPRTTSTVDDEEIEPVKLNHSLKKKLTAYDEVKAYLRKNSLVSKALTIFDVLQPTSITVREPQYIQVIDRYVLSKVWDDILPLTYGSYSNKLRLVNHYAVNLDNYETKLKELIQDYYQFTSRFIWKHINEEEKQKLAPKIYWMSLTNDEQNKFTKEIAQEEHTNQTVLELFAWRKLTEDEQQAFMQKPIRYEEKTENLLKNALQTNETESALNGVQRMDAEIKRAIKFLQISTDLRQYQKRADKQEPVPPKSSPKRATQRPRSTTNRILCRDDNDGYLYPGRVKKAADNYSYVVFDERDEQSIDDHILIPLNISKKSDLIPFDTVVVRQEGVEYWLPGIVHSLSTTSDLRTNVYQIKTFDPKEDEICAVRQDLIRIRRSEFLEILDYIRRVHPPIRTIDQNSSSNENLGKLIHDLLKPLNERVDHMTQNNEQRFNQLEEDLKDLISATRILQEKSSKPKQNKDNSIQTDDVPQPKPPSPPSSNSSSTTRTPTPSVGILARGTLVLALWKDDDGLFYEGKILESIDSTSYRVERMDLPDVRSIISRDDIFDQLQSCLLKDIDTKSKPFILAPYPNDKRQCYCPSVRISPKDQSDIKVRFYDCDTKDIRNKTRVYPISESQFQEYTSIRIDIEKSLVNQVIVGLNQKTNTYMLGTIIRRVGNGHRYQIEWYDKSESEQNDEHLFGAFVRRDQHHTGNYVLACDKDDQLYKFARIESISTSEKILQVKFLPPFASKSAEVPSVTTFVITETYYNSMCNDART